MLRHETKCFSAGRRGVEILGVLPAPGETFTQEFLGSMHDTVSEHCCATSRISGETIKAESWILRNLITILNKAAKRPHTPRSKEFRILFQCMGIEVNVTSSEQLDEGPLDSTAGDVVVV